MPLVSSLALMLVQMALTMYPQVPGEHSPPPPPSSHVNVFDDTSSMDVWMEILPDMRHG